MHSPFDDPDGSYLALVNDEGQYSLWPAGTVPPPDGWRTELGPATRQSCLDHITGAWTDLRPASLRTAAGAPPEG